MFGNSYKPKSTSNKAKKIIRDEIKSYDWNKNSLKDQIDDFKKYERNVKTYYHGGKKLVDDGSFACYYHQTDNMLNKIYGKENVKKWSNEKKWNTYTHLVSREINDICVKGKMSVGTNKKNKSVKK